MTPSFTLIITSPDGEREWQGAAIAAPRIGDDVTVRDEAGERFIDGQVEAVHWGFRKGSHSLAPGPVASVWLREVE
jgi:hypothetical protein